MNVTNPWTGANMPKNEMETEVETETESEDEDSAELISKALETINKQADVINNMLTLLTKKK